VSKSLTLPKGVHDFSPSTKKGGFSLSASYLLKENHEGFVSRESSGREKGIFFRQSRHSFLLEA
jgi:hypothetical protein